MDNQLRTISQLSPYPLGALHEQQMMSMCNDTYRVILALNETKIKRGYSTDFAHQVVVSSWSITAFKKKKKKKKGCIKPFGAPVGVAWNLINGFKLGVGWG